jgi:ferric-dicitrate binding protein FerR (iron transport regulator)
LRLASGPSLRVDVASALTLQSSGVVELHRGAIYIDTRGAVAGVRVETPLGALDDVGTQFEVRLTDASLALRVREGTVRWTHRMHTREVAAGRELTVDASLALREAAIEPHGPAWDWLDGITPALEIDGRTAAEFLHWAARERGVRLEYSSPALADTAQAVVLHGSVRGMTVDQALITVLPTCRLRHRFAGELLIVDSAE